MRLLGTCFFPRKLVPFKSLSKSVRNIRRGKVDLQSFSPHSSVADLKLLNLWWNIFFCSRRNKIIDIFECMKRTLDLVKIQNKQILQLVWGFLINVAGNLCTTYNLSSFIIKISQIYRDFKTLPFHYGTIWRLKVVLDWTLRHKSGWWWTLCQHAYHSRLTPRSWALKKKQAKQISGTSDWQLAMHNLEILWPVWFR